MPATTAVSEPVLTDRHDHSLATRPAPISLNNNDDGVRFRRCIVNNVVIVACASRPQTWLNGAQPPEPDKLARLLLPL